MVQRFNAVDSMRAVTISREYGSGGGEVAQRIAQQLGWKLVDHEIVVRVAQKLGMSEDEAEARDEHREGFISRLLRSMQNVDPNLTMGAPTLPVSPEREQEEYQQALSDVVKAAVDDGHVVIVGRGSQALLRDRRDVLHIRIVAPLAVRVSYVMQREGLEQREAEERIQLKDRDRVRYLQATQNLQSEDPHLYDLVINSAILDLDSIASLAITALEDKAKRLSVPAEQLGPSAGLARYPGQPGDIRPPVVR
jgi:cytidylate kinase